MCKLNALFFCFCLLWFFMLVFFCFFFFCRRVRTLYACLAENDGELSFEPNQIITNGECYFVCCVFVIIGSRYPPFCLCFQVFPFGR